MTHRPSPDDRGAATSTPPPLPSIVGQLAALRRTVPQGRTGLAHQGPQPSLAAIGAKQDIAVVYAVKMGYKTPARIEAYTGLDPRAIAAVLKRLVNADVLGRTKNKHAVRYTLRD